MNIVFGEGRAQRPVSRMDRAPRVRPGDRPSWTAVEVAPVDGRCWRDRARRRGLGVDAWLGVLVETLCVEAVLHLHGVAFSSLLASAAEDGADARLAPTDPLRRWVRLLDGEFREREIPEDELPTVVLPERLSAQIPSRELSETVRAAVSQVDEQMAVACDRVAALHGLTLESWALRTVLADARF